MRYERGSSEKSLIDELVTLQRSCKQPTHDIRNPTADTSSTATTPANNDLIQQQSQRKRELK